MVTIPGLNKVLSAGPYNSIASKDVPIVDGLFFKPHIIESEPNPLIKGTLKAHNWLWDGFRRDWDAHQFVGEKMAQGGSVVYRLLGLGLDKIGLKPLGNWLRDFADQSEPLFKAAIPWKFHFVETLVSAKTPLVWGSLLGVLGVTKAYGSVFSAEAAKSAERLAETTVKTLV